MRSILIKISLIITLLFIIDRSFYYFFKNKIFNNILSGQTGGYLNYLVKYKKNTDFLILGTSKAAKQINPAILFDGKLKGYNAGIQGIGEIIYNDILLDIAIKAGVKPKIILLQVDLFWFQNIKINNKELIALYPFINCSERLKYYININTYEEKLKLIFKSYRFNGKVLNVIKNYLSPPDLSNDNGFHPSPHKTVDSMNTVLSSKSVILNKTNLTIDTLRMNAVKNIINNCNNNHIKLIIFQTPSYNNLLFNQFYNSTLRTEMETKLNIPFIDFSNLPKPNSLQSPSLWRDAYHLNVNGAVILSNMLNDSIKLLELTL